MEEPLDGCARIPHRCWEENYLRFQTFHEEDEGRCGVGFPCVAAGDV